MTQIERQRPISSEILLEEIAVLRKTVANLEAEIRSLKLDRKTGAIRGDEANGVLNKIFQESSKLKTPIAIMLADINNFKTEQDKRSYGWGDEAIAMAAAALREHLRPADLLFRYGEGDEFLIILPGFDPSIVDVNKIRTRLEHSTDGIEIIERSTGYKGKISMTVGISVATNPPFDKLISNADLDLKNRKKARKIGR